MASTTIADYQVLVDGTFALGGNVTDKTLTFEVPSDFAREAGVRKPILAFKVRPDEDSVLKVSVNHHEIASFDFDRSHTRGYWETWSAKTAFPEGQSFQTQTPVRFFLQAGKVVLSDVVIWYQIQRDP